MAGHGLDFRVLLCGVSGFYQPIPPVTKSALGKFPDPGGCAPMFVGHQARRQGARLRVGRPARIAVIVATVAAQNPKLAQQHDQQNAEAE